MRVTAAAARPAAAAEIRIRNVFAIRRTAWTAVATVALAVLAPNASAQESLIDQQGKAFTLADLRGTAVVVTFVAARCTDACPLIDAQIAAAAHDARARALNVRFLTLTLDPEHDTPVAMRALANRFDARSPRWVMASGNPSPVHTLMRRFNVVAERGPDGVPEMHTTFVYILNARGEIARTLLASPNLSDDVFRAVQR